MSEAAAPAGTLHWDGRSGWRSIVAAFHTAEGAWHGAEQGGGQDRDGDLGERTCQAVLAAMTGSTWK